MHNFKYIFLSLAFCPLVAMSANKHVHGEAELFVALEGNQVLIEFESPADNIIGFEHAPDTPLQRQELARSLELLQEHSSIVSFSGTACKQISAEVTSPFASHNTAETHEKSHDSAHKKHEHKKNEHTEFHASYALECDADAQKTNPITVNAFKHFAGLRDVTVKWVTTNGQGSIKATAAKTELTLE